MLRELHQVRGAVWEPSSAPPFPRPRGLGAAVVAVTRVRRRSDPGARDTGWPGPGSSAHRAPAQHRGICVGDEEAASASCAGVRGGDVPPPQFSHPRSVHRARVTCRHVPPQGTAWPEKDGQHCPDVSTGRQVSQPAVSHRGASGKGARSRSSGKGLARCTVRPGLGPSRPRRDVAKCAYPEGGGQWAVYYSIAQHLPGTKQAFPKLYSIAMDLQRTPFNIRPH